MAGRLAPLPALCTALRWERCPRRRERPNHKPSCEPVGGRVGDRDWGHSACSVDLSRRCGLLPSRSGSLALGRTLVLNQTRHGSL